MQRIIVVSLGPGPRQQLTLGAVETLKKARRLILRTGETDAARCLTEQGIAFETLDALHEQCEDFDAFIAAAVEKVAKAAARARTVYAVLDALNDETVAALCRAYPEQVSLQGGGDLAAPLLQAARAGLPVRVAPATGLTVPCAQDGLLVVEMNTRMLAGECKLKLTPWYGDEYPALFFPPAEKEERRCLSLPLCEIDRQPRYDHTAAVYLPPLPLEKKQRFDLWDLVRVMARLRGENGCPWDRAQTHRTLSRYLIEEAYETAEAVEAEDWEHVAEELGDVLLQVFFQSDIGAQYGTFELSDVSTAICRKMMERHAHIFGGERCETPQDVADMWERMKQRQRGNTTIAAALKDVSAHLPALLRAEKILKKAEGFGLDAAALAAASPAAGLLREVQKLREAGLCAEEETQIALQRVVQRVEKAENAAKLSGKSLENLTSDEINVYLQRESKHRPKQGVHRILSAIKKEENQNE